MAPISLDVPSFADELRTELSELHKEAEVSKETFASKRPIKKIVPKKVTSSASASQSKDLLRKKAKAPRSEVSRAEISEGKKVAAEVEQGEVPMIVEQEEEIDIMTISNSEDSWKRSSKEVDPPLEESEKTKRAKMDHGFFFEFNEDTPLYSHAGASADFCYYGGSSGEFIPKLAVMEDGALYSMYAQRTLQAMGAVNEITRRLHQRVQMFETDLVKQDELKRATTEAAQAFDVERVRADRAEAELKDVVASLHDEQILRSTVTAELKKLQEKHGALEVKFDKETQRLRNSRTYQVITERKIQDGIKAGCQSIFDKVKLHLASRKEAERIKGLYGQAKGTREMLELLRTTGSVEVPDSVIADLKKREAEYVAEAAKMDMVELNESELQVPDFVKGVSFEEQAQVNVYGTNEGTISQEDVRALKTQEPIKDSQELPPA